MNKIEWENYQDGDSTPLNAENLNLMQDNIEEAINDIDISDQLATKADKVTTYTKTEVDSELSLKADKLTTYTKSEVDNELDLKADKTYVTTGTESPTQEYIDGKQVFVKRINFGALPNNTTKNVAHGLNWNAINVVRFNGIAHRPSDNISLSLPVPSLTQPITIYLNTTSIVIQSTSDRSGYTQTYIEVYYYYN